MPEQSTTLNSSRPQEEVFKTLEDALTVLGQCSITKKGGISVNPKGSYSGFLSQAGAMEGTIRQKRDNQYEVTLTYNTTATLACWGIVFVFGWIGIGLLAPAVPFYTARKKISEDILRAFNSTQQDLE